jgi:L-ascorbate metabolism protein UlaG (beta-lactamase superfamily)
MKVTKLGHCCLLIEIRGIRFLTDPGSYTTEQNTVTGIHYIVISHEHTDHLHIDSLKTVLKNNPDAKVICNNGVGAKLTAESIPFTLIEDGVELELSGVTLTGHGTKHAPIYKEYEQVENTGIMYDGKYGRLRQAAAQYVAAAVAPGNDAIAPSENSGRNVPPDRVSGPH